MGLRVRAQGLGFRVFEVLAIFDPPAFVLMTSFVSVMVYVRGLQGYKCNGTWGGITLSLQVQFKVQGLRFGLCGSAMSRLGSCLTQAQALLRHVSRLGVTCFVFLEVTVEVISVYEHS